MSFLAENLALYLICAEAAHPSSSVSGGGNKAITPTTHPRNRGMSKVSFPFRSILSCTEFPAHSQTKSPMGHLMIN